MRTLRNVGTALMWTFGAGAGTQAVLGEAMSSLYANATTAAEAAADVQAAADEDIG